MSRILFCVCMNLVDIGYNNRVVFCVFVSLVEIDCV